MRSQMIDLKLLEVNTHNFRHQSVETIEQAIKLNIDEDIDSFKKLILSMEEDLRAINFILLKEDDKYTVMDANRRLSVIRMKEDNSLIPDGDAYNEIRTLISGTSFEIPEKVYCDVYNDTDSEKRLLINRLEEIHLKDDDTKKEWNALSQYRASIEIGLDIQYPWIKTILYYEGDDKDETIKSYLPKNIDVFNRALNRKQQLNIQEDGSIGHHNDSLIYSDILDFVTKRKYIFSSNEEVRINTRTPLEKYQEIIEDIINKHKKQDGKIEQTLTKNRKKTPVDNENNEATEPNISTPVNSSKADTVASPAPYEKPFDLFDGCKTVIPKKFEIHSSNVRINKIIDELKRLNVDQFPNACGLLLRILFELSAKDYLERKDGKVLEEAHFEALLKRAREDLTKNKHISNSQKAHLKSDQSTLNHLFNGYAHNTDTYPSTEALKAYFKSHRTFLVACLTK